MWVVSKRISLLGVLLRFQQHQYAFIGDVRKMFHAIDIPTEDQMMHLFVWRNCSDQNPIETYAMTAVNMGDRPSATIAQLALKKTAEIEQENTRDRRALLEIWILRNRPRKESI